MGKVLRILAWIAASPLLLAAGVPLLLIVLVAWALWAIFGVIEFALTGKWLDR